MMATGIASAATIRAGNQMGLKDIPTLIKVGKSSFFMSAVIMISWALFFILGNNWLPTLYVDEMPVILLSGSLLVIAAFFQVSDGLQVVGLGVLRGMEDVKMPTLITLIAYWIFGLPISYLLGFVFDIGIQGIWIGLLIGLSVSAFSLIARFNRLVKQKLKIYMEI